MTILRGLIVVLKMLLQAAVVAILFFQIGCGESAEQIAPEPDFSRQVITTDYAGIVDAFDKVCFQQIEHQWAIQASVEVINKYCSKSILALTDFSSCIDRVGHVVSWDQANDDDHLIQFEYRWSKFDPITYGAPDEELTCVLITGLELEGAILGLVDALNEKKGVFSEYNLDSSYDHSKRWKNDKDGSLIYVEWNFNKRYLCGFNDDCLRVRYYPGFPL